MNKKRILIPIVAALAVMVGAASAFAISGSDMQNAKTLNASNSKNDFATFNLYKGAYSSWEKGEKAIKVNAAFSNKLTNYNGTKAAKTSIDADSGNTTSKVLCQKGDDYVLYMDPDDDVVYNLDSHNNPSVTYNNVYIYDKNDSKAMKSGRPGYVKLDLVAKVTSYTHKEYAHNTRKTDNSYIGFGKVVRGLPSIDIYNVGQVKIKYSYYYHGTSEPYTLKSNTTYADIDASQGQGFEEDQVLGMYVTKDTNLGYVHTDNTEFFQDLTNKSVSSTPQSAAAYVYQTTSEKLTYVSNEWSDDEDLHQQIGHPSGEWSHFQASTYSLVEPTYGDPVKSVTDADGRTYDAANNTWSDGDDNSSEISNGVWSPKSKWDFEVTQNIPNGMAPAYYYNKFELDDDMSGINDLVDICQRIESGQESRNDQQSNE